MGAAKVFTPVNGLAGIIAPLNGSSTSELVAAAERRVSTMELKIQTFVLAQTEGIVHYARLDDDTLFQERAKLQTLALSVAEVAGAGGMPTFGEICRGICIMIDRHNSHGLWHAAAMKLHIHSLKQTLAQKRQKGGEDKTIVDNLVALRQALGFMD